MFLQNQTFPNFEKFKNSKLSFKVKQKSRIFAGVLSTTNEFKPLSEYLTSYGAHRSIASNVSSRKTLQRPKQHPTCEEFRKT
jgi:hypothetical protein